MNVLNSKNSLKKLAGILGVATLSSLIGLPVFAQLNSNDDRGFRVAQNTPVSPTDTDPTNNRDRSTTPNSVNSPATECAVPDTDSPTRASATTSETTSAARATDGTSSSRNSTGNISGTQGTNSSTTEICLAPGSESNPGSSTTVPGSRTVPGDSSTTPGTRNTPTTPGTQNTPTTPGTSPRSQSDNNSRTSLSATDRNFIMEAARDGMAEVALGQLATQKGSSDAVKQYGQTMVEQHSQANNELASLASQKGVTLPTDIGPQNQAVMQRLSGLSGASFDQAYMTEMVRAHNKAISLFQIQARQGQDGDLKTWATQKVPTLQAHLQTASNIARR